MPSDSEFRQERGAGHATYVWSRIDPRRDQLIADKLSLLLEKLRKNIRARAAKIIFDNRLNPNKTGVDHQVVTMWSDEIYAHALRCYDMLCEHWRLLGVCRE
jgi:hypothetical protein